MELLANEELQWEKLQKQFMVKHVFGHDFLQKKPLEQLIYRFKRKRYKRGSIIFQEGKLTDEFHILYSGEVLVSKPLISHNLYQIS